MKNDKFILITGGAGFLGKYVVSEALLRGYKVRATYRKKQNFQIVHENLEWIQLNLSEDTEQLLLCLQDVDVVIHLAAAMKGDYKFQYKNTIIGTENLLDSMLEAKVNRLIAVSSFSVYDYKNISENSVINEDSLLDLAPINRDVYAKIKIIQEGLLNEFKIKNKNQVTIIRPGIIFGLNNLWNSYLGINLKNICIRLSSEALLPLVYVENCADAILNSLNNNSSVGQTINVVDDSSPLQEDYLKKIFPLLKPKPFILSIDWKIVLIFAKLVSSINVNLFKGKLKLPSVLVPERLFARYKPMHYSNIKAKQLLDWIPKYSYSEIFERIATDSFNIVHFRDNNEDSVSNR